MLTLPGWLMCPHSAGHNLHILSLIYQLPAPPHTCFTPWKQDPHTARHPLHLTDGGSTPHADQELSSHSPQALPAQQGRQGAQGQKGHAEGDTAVSLLQAHRHCLNKSHGKDPKTVKQDHLGLLYRHLKNNRLNF